MLVKANYARLHVSTPSYKLDKDNCFNLLVLESLVFQSFTSLEIQLLTFIYYDEPQIQILIGDAFVELKLKNFLLLLPWKADNSNFHLP